MRVRVDEAGRDDQVGRIDNLLRALGDLADLDDLAARNRDIGAPRRATGTINDRSVFNQEIERHKRSLPLAFGASLDCRCP